MAFVEYAKHDATGLAALIRDMGSAFWPPIPDMNDFEPSAQPDPGLHTLRGAVAYRLWSSTSISACNWAAAARFSL